MTQTRRMGVEGSKQRTLFVDAAAELLRTEGYQSLSARQVAAKAGLKTQLLYYYFRTMDELILEVVRSVNARRQQRFEEALTQAEPLRALWKLSSDPSSAAMSSELTTIAAHREPIRAEIVRSAQEFRAQQVKAVSQLLGQGDNGDQSAAGLVMIAVGLARTLVTEASLGLTDGHQEAIALVERWITELSRTAQASPPKSDD